MDRRSIHRALVALALVVGLMLAGVQPAAAREPGSWGLILDRLLNLLDAEENDSRSLWEVMGGWIAEKSSDDDRGAGLDPNGSSVETSQDPSGETSPNG